MWPTLAAYPIYESAILALLVAVIVQQWLVARRYARELAADGERT